MAWSPYSYSGVPQKHSMAAARITESNKFSVTTMWLLFIKLHKQTNSTI